MKKLMLAAVVATSFATLVKADGVSSSVVG